MWASTPTRLYGNTPTNWNLSNSLVYGVIARMRQHPWQSPPYDGDSHGLHPRKDRKSTNSNLSNSLSCAKSIGVRNHGFYKAVTAVEGCTLPPYKLYCGGGGSLRGRLCPKRPLSRVLWVLSWRNKKVPTNQCMLATGKHWYLRFAARSTTAGRHPELSISNRLISNGASLAPPPTSLQLKSVR